MFELKTNVTFEEFMSMNDVQATALVIASDQSNNVGLRPLIHDKYRRIIEELSLFVPDSIIKIHEPHVQGGLDHIHFYWGQTYLMDGSWDHNKGLNLGKETIVFIKTIGFPEPHKSDAYENERDELEIKSPTEFTMDELKKKTGLNEIPHSVRAVHQAHGNGQQTHIHFFDKERSLNLDGTWEQNDSRQLTLEEEQFVLRMGFTLPQESMQTKS